MAVYHNNFNPITPSRVKGRMVPPRNCYDRAMKTQPTNGRLPLRHLMNLSIWKTCKACYGCYCTIARHVDNVVYPDFMYYSRRY